MEMLRPAALVVLLSLASLAHAADPTPVLLYRYIDNNGRTVLDRLGVPSEYIAKGYQVLNGQGVVISVVPAALSGDELQHQKSVDAAAKAQATSDMQLRRLYSGVADIDLAKSRKLAEIDGLISIAKGNQQLLRSQQDALQQQAAQQERAGREVPAQVLEQLNSLKDDQKVQTDNIARYQKNREAAEQSFNADRARLVQLQNGS